MQALDDELIMSRGWAEDEIDADKQKVPVLCDIRARSVALPVFFSWRSSPQVIKRLLGERLLRPAWAEEGINQFSESRVCEIHNYSCPVFYSQSDAWRAFAGASVKSPSGADYEPGSQFIIFDAEQSHGPPLTHLPFAFTGSRPSPHCLSQSLEARMS